MLTQAVDQGWIKGFYIAQTDDQVTHGQFVDDTNVIIKAKHEYVDATFQIF